MYEKEAQPKGVSQYTYDALGNMTQETVTPMGAEVGIGAGAGAGGYQRSYAYNALNQLVSREETQLGATAMPFAPSIPSAQPTALIYEYDKRGNRTRERSVQTGEVTKSYFYDAANRMVRGETEKGTSAYGYDVLGRRVTREQEKSSLQYVVDFVSGRNDDLAAYSSSRAEDFFTQNYSYANGQRIEQTTQLWQDVNRASAGNSVTQGTSLPVLPTLPGLSVSDLPEALYIHEDIMGSAKRFATDTGETYAQIEYDVWGAPINNGNADGFGALNPRYTNHTYDDVLGAYHAQYRMYDAMNRGFTAQDPSEHGLNWYRYVESNPLSLMDPLGLEETKVVINGETIQVDTGDKDSVLDMYRNFDDTAHPAGWLNGEMSVYNYDTSSANRFKYDKNSTMDELLGQAGIHEGSGSAYFSKIQCDLTGADTYMVFAPDKYLHQLGMSREEMLSYLGRVSGVDYEYMVNMASFFGSAQAGVYLNYIFNERNADSERLLLNLNWTPDNYALAELFYRTGKEGYSPNDLANYDRMVQWGKTLTLLGMAGYQLANAATFGPSRQVPGGDGPFNLPSQQPSSNSSSNSSTYTPPSGGGGTTSTISMGGKTFTFGHGGRHATDAGVNPGAVNNAIAKDVLNRSTDSIAKGEYGRVTVGGVSFQYRPYLRPDGTVHIGTYFPKR